MIVVKVEMYPQGQKEGAYLLCCATIANDGTGDETTGNYEFALSYQTNLTSRRGSWRTGHVAGFPRKGRGVWDLLYRVLCSAGMNQRNRTQTSDNAT